MDVPFRKNAAIAIDGGGIKGAMVTRALRILEESGEMGSCRDTFRLTAGTSTGSIIAAALPLPDMPPAKMDELYQSLGPTVFRRRWWSMLWWLIGYRYPGKPLASALENYIKGKTMGGFWHATPRTDVVITAFDLQASRSLFIKSYKKEYEDWPVAKAVLASSTVPTYFPVVDGRYVDGGVGAYMNPCYLAAWEIYNSPELGWDPSETTLISLGTGRGPQANKLGNRSALEWVGTILDVMLQAASDQQVNMVRKVFPKLDFRRFQVDTKEHIPMDDPAWIPQLQEYGKELAHKIKKNDTDEPPPDPVRDV